MKIQSLYGQTENSTPTGTWSQPVLHNAPVPNKNTNKKKNKRPMGHIAHPRKQFKLINTYGYIITLIRSGTNLLFEN